MGFKKWLPIIVTFLLVSSASVLATHRSDWTWSSSDGWTSTWQESSGGRYKHVRHLVKWRSASWLSGYQSGDTYEHDTVFGIDDSTDGFWTNGGLWTWNSDLPSPYYDTVYLFDRYPTITVGSFRPRQITPGRYYLIDIVLDGNGPDASDTVKIQPQVGYHKTCWWDAPECIYPEDTVTTLNAWTNQAWWWACNPRGSTISCTKTPG